MVENFEFRDDKGEKAVTSIPSLAEMIDARDMHRHGGSDRQMARLEGDAAARVETAHRIMEPIIAGIQSLPREHRMQFLASLKGMDGPAYDLVRSFCTSDR